MAGMEDKTMSTVLDIQNLSVAYNRKGLALEDVSLQVPQGGIVALLGRRDEPAKHT